MAKKKKVGTKVPTLKEIESRYGSSLMMSAADADENILWIPSTFFALNHLTGGGVPYGKVMEIMGEESSGKSLVANNFAYACQQLGGHVIWVDAEQAYTNEWAIANNIDPNKVTLLNDTEIETISDAIADLAIYLRSKLVNNEPILLVVDSIAALDCSENINSKMTDSKADMGNRAKALYKMLRIRNELLYKLGVTSIYINQLRVKLGVMFGDNNTTPGGKAMGFYASIRLAFFGGKTHTTKWKGKERKDGKYVTVRVIKNKVAPPRATISKAPMFFTSQYSGKEIGFDRCYALEDALVDCDVIEKRAGGTYLYKGETLCRGEEKFKALLEEDDDLRRKLLRKAGINTIATTRKQLAKIDYNMYPVSEDLDYEAHTDAEDSEDDEE